MDLLVAVHCTLQMDWQAAKGLACGKEYTEPLLWIMLSLRFYVFESLMYPALATIQHHTRVQGPQQQHQLGPAAADRWVDRSSPRDGVVHGLHNSKCVAPAVGPQAVVVHVMGQQFCSDQQGSDLSS